MNADVRFDVEFTEETSTFEADVGEVFFSGGEDVVLQSKSVTPTEAIQEVTADEGYTALEKVTVEAIPSEYIVPSGDLAITENGTFDVTQYASAEVNVPSEEPILAEITITENGEYTPSGDGYSKVTVAVEPNLQEKTATENGEVTPDEGYDGLSKVTVNVDSGEFVGKSPINVTDKSHIPQQGYSRIAIAVPITINTTEVL